MSKNNIIFLNVPAIQLGQLLVTCNPTPKYYCIVHPVQAAKKFTIILFVCQQRTANKKFHNIQAMLAKSLLFRRVHEYEMNVDN